LPSFTLIDHHQVPASWFGWRRLIGPIKRRQPVEDGTRYGNASAQGHPEDVLGRRRPVPCRAFLATRMMQELVGAPAQAFSDVPSLASSRVSEHNPDLLPPMLASRSLLVIVSQNMLARRLSTMPSLRRPQRSLPVLK